MPDHTEMLTLARRLERTDIAHARDDRRALLLFWYGTGASRLRAEAVTAPAARAEHARLASAVADVAADPRPSAAALRRIGAALLRIEHEVDETRQHAHG
jgi:hypothetical protein